MHSSFHYTQMNLFWTEDRRIFINKYWFHIQLHDLWCHHGGVYRRFRYMSFYLHVSRVIIFMFKMCTPYIRVFKGHFFVNHTTPEVTKIICLYMYTCTYSYSCKTKSHTSYSVDWSQFKMRPEWIREVSPLDWPLWNSTKCFHHHTHTKTTKIS